MSSVDVDKLATILRDAAQAEIMPRFRRLDASMVRQKSEAIDLVTEADEAAERHIKAAVAVLAPEALLVGEESVAANPTLMDGISDSDLTIIVDPVDGTANYAAGMPLFGVMAAVISKGETIAGIIFDPMGDDWVIAEKGSGAWQRTVDGSQTKLNVAQPVALERMVGAVSTAFLASETRGVVLGNLARVRMNVNYRCAAHEYRTMAAGHLHFTMYNKILPWDHLAGTLIVQEAGGYAARFDGSAYLPIHTSGGLLLTPDQESWELLRRELFAAPT